MVRNLPCCHECGAGADGIPYEDVASDMPVWANTRFSSRPWSTPPAMDPVPFSRLAPEKQYRRDCFHLTKVGIYRDLAGSCLCYLAVKGYYGEQGDINQKLSNAHGAFALYCQTTGKSPALRTFSKFLLMYPRLDSFPWANVKGSDCMILLSFLMVQCHGFANTPLDPSHVRILKLCSSTCKAARDVIGGLNAHNLWMEHKCTMGLQADMSRFVTGYVLLAGALLNDTFNGFSIKPKLHLFKHQVLEYHEALLRGDEVILNWNVFGCESCEDLIGKVCRLSRRLDSRRIGERLLGCTLVKSAMLHRRFKKVGRL